MELPENLKKLRKNSKQTQERIAEQLSITQRAYSNYETGKTEPNIETLWRMADLYQTTIDILIGRTKPLQ